MRYRRQLGQKMVAALRGTHYNQFDLNVAVLPPIPDAFKLLHLHALIILSNSTDVSGCLQT